MRLWAELYEGDDYSLVDLQGVQINRVLGRPGDLQIILPGLENRFRNLQGREVFVYTDWPEKHLLAQGVIKESVYGKQAGPESYAWKVLDGLEAFKNKNTWRNLAYDDWYISDIVRDLVGRVEGWRARIDNNLSSESTSIAFDDGITVLDALKKLAQVTGMHFQAGRNANEVLFSAMGGSSNLILKNITRAGREVYQNPNLLPIEKIEIVEDSYDIVNYVEPIIGNGNAVLTLRRSTISSPYAVEAVSLNGRTCYILKDDESISLYGQVERVWTLEDAIPVNLSLEGAVNMANVLYTWAARRLARTKQPKKTYRVTVKTGSRVIIPGEKVYVSYHGEIFKAGERVDVADIDGEFWVTRVSENYGTTGSMTLEISNIDEPRVIAEEAIADNILEQRRGQKKVRPDISTNSLQFPQLYLDKADTDGTAFTLRVSDIALDVASAKLTLTRANFEGPDTITIKIDGENRTEALGGPWLGGSGYGDEFTIDIVDYLTDNNIQGEHEVVLFCAYGYGYVDVTVELGEIVASVVR